MGGIVVALGMLVVGVSLLAVPTDAPVTGTRTRVAGIYAVASPSPSPSPQASPGAPGATFPSPIPPAPIAISGPRYVAPWTVANYDVTFTGSGSRSVELWWSGAAMGDWTWQRLDGHCELTPARDKLSGTVLDRVIIRLQLTPSGAPGGQLTFSGRVDGGQTYALAVVNVG